MSKSRKTPVEPPPPPSKEPSQPSNVSGVKALMNKFEESIANQDLKVSVTEYIRLVQLDREVEAVEPHPIEVLWIERMESLYDGVD